MTKGKKAKEKEDKKSEKTEIIRSYARIREENTRRNGVAGKGDRSAAR